VQPIADAIKRHGITPDAFALSAYDALFVVHARWKTQAT